MSATGRSTGRSAQAAAVSATGRSIGRSAHAAAQAAAIVAACRQASAVAANRPLHRPHYWWHHEHFNECNLIGPLVEKNEELKMFF